MREKSSIIHISSTRAIQSEPQSEAYASAKSGLIGLTHAQAVTLGDQRIRVNTILPGWINTALYRFFILIHLLRHSSFMTSQNL